MRMRMGVRVWFGAVRCGDEQCVCVCVCVRVCVFVRVCTYVCVLSLAILFLLWGCSKSEICFLWASLVPFGFVTKGSDAGVLQEERCQDG